MYDKLLACFYCGKTLKHRISEHLESMHKNETDVAKAFALKGKDRKNAITLLRNKGNFKHNIKVLTSKQDNIIVARRPPKSRLIPSNYLPCTYCYAFYQKDEFWRHAKACPFRQKLGETGRPALTASARLLLKSAVLPETKGTADGEKLLLALCTKRDEIAKLVIHDKILIHFGKTLLQKLGTRRKNDISQRLRQLARLKIAINDMTESKHDQMYDIIAGKHFDLVVSAVKELVISYETEEGIIAFEKPGLALRLGHNLVKIGQIKFGMALRTDDTVGEKEAESFSKLLSNEWCDQISTIALATLKANKFNKPEILPVTSDLLKLKKYLSLQILELGARLEATPCYQTWRNLAEVTLTRIVLMNKRRGSETSKLLINAYLNRPNWKESANQEILESLTDLEKQMFARFVIMLWRL